MLKLVSTTDNPRPSILDERHEAEWLQALLNDEQAEANGIAAFVAAHIAAFVGGIFFCLVSEIVILLIVKGVPW